MSIPKLNSILYVEDEPDIQEIVKISLENVGGYSLQIFNSGNEFLSEGIEYQPDLFLLDVMIPGMDGPTILEEIRKIPKFKETPVIFITAKVQLHELISYRELGVVGIIQKPFDPMTISQTIKQLWEEYHQKDKLDS